MSSVTNMTPRGGCTGKKEDRQEQESMVFQAETGFFLQARAWENYTKQVDLHHKASGI